MYPEHVEEHIRQEAAEMKLSEQLDAYGYEKVEFEILCQTFGKLKELHPEILKEIIQSELDFYLESVDEPEN